jgi:sialate O-acetylesterase
MQMSSPLLVMVAWGMLLGFPHLQAGEASLRLAGCFVTSMVLQREMPVPIWGWGAAEAEISVRFNGQQKATRVDADGRWRVVLDPMAASATAGVLQASDTTQTVVLDQVLVGDVWLCAGPGIMRNMGALPNAKQEIAKVRFPQVRILRPDIYRSLVPVADLPPPAVWTAADPAGIERYAITWFLGRELHATTGVPIGIILANAETESPQDWLPWKRDPQDRLQNEAMRLLTEQLPQDIARAEEWLFRMRGREPQDPIDLLLFPTYIPYAFYNRHPVYDGPFPITYQRSLTHNAVINPLVPLAVRGVVLNCEFESKHGAVKPAALADLIASWRAAWGRPALPFVVAEPVGKYEPATLNALIAAAKQAGTLGQVVVAPRPSAFVEAKSEEYWKQLAGLAAALAKETVPSSAVLTPWVAPRPVNVADHPARRRLEAAHLFADHMILQCDQPIPVWGWSEPAESVAIAFAGQRRTAIADAGGRWRVTFEAMPASDSPQTMTITGQRDTLNVTQVLIGEVWINSGQSNSGYVLSATTGFAEEQPTANHPSIRYFANARAANVLPQRRNLGSWIPVSPETAGRMSGMGYYFARAIQRERRVPVGIIEANHGGSTILSWMSDAAFGASPKFANLRADRALVREEMVARLPLVEDAVRRWVTAARGNADLARPVMPFPIDASPIRPFYASFLQNPMNRRGSMFYNAMIHSMIGYGIRGVIWNQGEADTGNERTAIYDELMAAMVADWRTSWGCEFPFYFVQMPALRNRDGLLGMWTAQARALTRIPSSGMIVCNDISEPERGEGGIHPRDKKSVGERLARLALVRTYGMKGMIDASPMMRSVTREGSRAVVTFSSPAGGLKTRDGKAPDSWELAGADGKFIPAVAECVGDHMIVGANGITEPSAVRLGWRPDSNCNLVNGADLPALPFTATITTDGR